MLPEKRFGIFKHRVTDHTSLLMRGMNDEMPIPVSRHTENRREDFLQFPHLEIVAESDEAGLCLIHDTQLRHVHMFNHLEYDSDTLGDEYKRDRGTKAKQSICQKYYYPDNNPEAAPVNRWRANAHLLFGNWLNYIYVNYALRY